MDISIQIEIEGDIAVPIDKVVTRLVIVAGSDGDRRILVSV
jgi:hypothetical protein